MSRTILRICGAAVLIFWTSAGMAGPVDMGTSYAGIQFATITYSQDGLSEDLEPTALVGRIGTFAEDGFSVEGRFGFGLSDDSATISGGEADFEIDHLFGVYGLGHVPVGDRSSVYGALGLTTAKGTASTDLGSDSESESGLSFGVGVDLGLSGTVALNVEYMQYLDKSDFDASALSVGVLFSY